jgi:hypothetical protein
MGLGPYGSSLAYRIALPPPVWSNPFAMQMEGLARAEARRERAVWHRMKHAVARKPEAPVTAEPKHKGIERDWVWTGESILSKNLHQGGHYSGAMIRKAGFKLPKLEKHKAGEMKRVKDGIIHRANTDGVVKVTEVKK